MALLSRVTEHEELLQMIVDRTQLLQRETFLANDLAMILIYDQVFGTRVRGKFKVRILHLISSMIFCSFFKGMVKRNQSSIDECVNTLLNEYNVQSLPELLEVTSSPSIPSISIPRYVRINLLKTTGKQLRLNLKELSFKKIKNV